jgi:hypothetical protein
VGEGGIGNVEFLLDFADDQAIGMRGQEQLHDAQPGLGSHRREHIRVSDNLFGGLLRGERIHISIIAEIRFLVKGMASARPMPVV